MIVPYPLFLTEWTKSSYSKPSEKGYEQRSERGFGRYTEHEKGQTASFRPPVVLGPV